MKPYSTSPLEAMASALLDPHSAVPLHVQGDARHAAARRFAVHRNTFVHSLVDALADAFPVTLALLGDACFRAMARDRVLHDPPGSPILTEYVRGFADFVADFALLANLAWLPHVVRLESLRIESYHAADAQPLDAGAFTALLQTPERLPATRAALHPAVRWLRTPTCTFDLWHAHSAMPAPDDATLEALDLAHAQDVLVARPHLHVETVVLPPGMADVLDALDAGLPFGEAIAHPPRAAPEVVFSLLIGHGLLSALHTDGDPT